MTFKAALGIALMGFVWTAQAACPTAPGRFVTNGAEVTDSQTGLVWARCSVGQSWSGSACTGSYSTHTHEQALALANASDGWRLPNKRELGSLADRGCQNPSIDSTAFPNTISTWYWTSTPYVENFSVTLNAWHVTFTDGFILSSGRGSRYAVRLVRATH